MDEFFNNNENDKAEIAENNYVEPQVETISEPSEPTEEAVLENSEQEVFTESDANIQQQYPPVYNPINYTPVKPIEDYKPVSKGLKVFSLILACILVLTGTCLAGYFVGKKSVKSNFKGSVASQDLAAKPTKTDELTEAQVYDKVNESIVGIVVYNSAGAGSQASGIVYSEDGYIVTNDHIYSEVAGPKFKIYTHDGTEYDADYVAGDKVSDLAVLKIKGGKFKPAVFGNSDELFYGEHVVAIGRPNDATDATSITRGVISAINRRVQTTSSYSARLIQTDSAINPGSSGGALVNMYGQVIGVTSSKLASTEYDAVGYAIPTTTMKRIVDELLAKGKVISRAKLGVSYNAIDSVTAEVKGYDYVGLYLASIDEESGLYGKAESGDVITHINGIAIVRDDVVLDIIEQSKAGDIVDITIVTADNQTKTVKAELKANVSESSYIAKEALQGNGNAENPNGNNGGKFDFPFGE